MYKSNVFYRWVDKNKLIVGQWYIYIVMKLKQAGMEKELEELNRWLQC